MKFNVLVITTVLTAVSALPMAKRQDPSLILEQQALDEQASYSMQIAAEQAAQNTPARSLVARQFSAELAAQNALQAQTTEEEFAQKMNDAAWQTASSAAAGNIQRRQADAAQAQAQAQAQELALQNADQQQSAELQSIQRFNDAVSQASLSIAGKIQRRQFEAELAAQNALQAQTTAEEFAQKLNDAVWKNAASSSTDKIQKRECQDINDGPDPNPAITLWRRQSCENPTISAPTDNHNPALALRKRQTTYEVAQEQADAIITNAQNTINTEINAEQAAQQQAGATFATTDSTNANHFG